MYLVTAEHYEHSQPQSQSLTSPPVKTRPIVKTKRVAKKMKKYVTKDPHDKWVSLHTKLLEADIKETDLIHRFADFLRKILPQSALQKTPRHRPQFETRPKSEMCDIAETPQRSPTAQQTGPSSVGDERASYEVSKNRLSSSSYDVEKSDGDAEVRGVYEVSSPYLNKMLFLEEQYGLRREGNNLRIGNTHVIAEEKVDINTGWTRFRGTRVYGNS